jgi:hypothetical protein
MHSLSRTVDNVEFPIAASSEYRASLYRRLNASLLCGSTLLGSSFEKKSLCIRNNR